MGPPTPREQRTLMKAVSRLCDTLVEAQLENHCAELASKCPFGEGAQRAFVAHDDHAFGMLRVHQNALEQRDGVPLTVEGGGSGESPC